MSVNAWQMVLVHPMCWCIPCAVPGINTIHATCGLFSVCNACIQSVCPCISSWTSPLAPFLLSGEMSPGIAWALVIRLFLMHPLTLCAHASRHSASDPFLSGEMSPGVAWALVISLAVAGMSIVALNFGTLISSLYAFGIGLGTVYSIPPFRYHERKGRAA